MARIGFIKIIVMCKVEGIRLLLAKTETQFPPLCLDENDSGIRVQMSMIVIKSFEVNNCLVGLHLVSSCYIS